MVAHVGTAFSSANPHVRQIDPWRDGRAVANLLESAFRDEIIDDNGQRLIHSLRYYGAFEALTFVLGTGFVWVEGGEVIGNASVQRNLTRKDTWVIGNVATSLAYRNRGIGRGVVEACIQHAASRGAANVALQADATNKPALHLYEKLGFERLGEITHYHRAPVRAQPVQAVTESRLIRKAKWSDRAAVWALTKHNLPDRFMLSEPFDKGMYQLGFRWSLMNALSGNVEQWLVSTGGDHHRPIGAVRTRVNYEGSNHHLELMLGDGATTQDGIALLNEALKRFDIYLSKPIYAAQSRPHERSHEVLQVMGFTPTRTLVHMRLELKP